MSAPAETTAASAPPAPETAIPEPNPTTEAATEAPIAPEATAAPAATTTTAEPSTKASAATTNGSPQTTTTTKPAATKQILVIGASSAGISCAHYILRHIVPALPHPETYHVTLIGPSSKWMNRVAAPRSLVSEKLLPLAKWTMDIEAGFKEYAPGKFSFVQGLATALDTTARTVTIAKPAGGGEPVSLEYYTLLIATGASSPTPLFGSVGPHTEAQAAIEAFRAKLPEAKSIVIAGGGPAGVETAGEIGHFLNGRAGLFSARLAKVKTKITLVTNADKLLPVLRPALAKKAEKLLNKVGVDVVYGAAVTATEPATAGKLNADGGLGDLLAPTKVTLANGEVLEADLYIPAYGLSPNTSWLPADLRNEKGFVNTNKETLRVDAAGPRVYAVGEVGSYGIGGLFELQLGAIPVVMVNMKRDLLYDAKVEAAGGEKVAKTGKDMILDYKVGESQMVPVGRRSGVAALWGWRMPSFAVWLIKGRQYLTELNNMNVTGAAFKSEAKWKHM